MITAPPIDSSVGMAFYVSETSGTGGTLRAKPEDFRVREIKRVDLHPTEANNIDYNHLVINATLRAWDTHRFASELSDRLGISRERISWAGTKDKQAVTTQLFSIEGIAPERLPSIPNAEINPVGRMGRRLVLGDLAGNEFEITVRCADHPEHAEPITRELRDFAKIAVGVPNYFGHQRFGSIRPVTHQVGFHILNGNWKAAVLSYVGNPHENEPAQTQKVREFIETTEDWKEALERFPQHLHYERVILHGLVSSQASGEKRFREALETLPVNLQRLFVHAAQSYVFNLILSERLEQNISFNQAVIGDVVCFSETIGGVTIPDPDRMETVTADNEMAINRHLDRGRAFITAPLVGTETTYSSGVPGEIVQGILDEMGIDKRDFDLPGEFYSSGTRRAILVVCSPQISVEPLRITFSFPKGSYATVLLREYLKTSPVDQ